MRTWLLLLALIAASAFSAEVKDVDFSCSAKDCAIRFQFSSAKDLPNFFQKFDAASHKLTIGFSNSKFALGEGSFPLEENSSALQRVRIFTDASFKIPLLKFEFAVGSAIVNDKNPVSLSGGKNFVIALPKSKSSSWSLSGIASKQLKVEKQTAVADKKPAAEQARLGKQKAEADRKAAAEQARLEKQKAEADRKAAAEQARLGKQKAEADRKAAAEQARLEKQKAEADKKAELEAEKVAREAETQAAAKKVVSALIEGVKEMTDVKGNGLEQFRIVTDTPIDISKVNGPDKASAIMVSIKGPQKAPLFKVSSSGIVKSVTWTSAGLRIQLYPEIRPIAVVYKGSLILQVPAVSKPGFECYIATPAGVYFHQWKNAEESSAPAFDVFANTFQNDKKIVSVAQSFQLRPVSRDLIVVTESTPLLASPSDNAHPVQNLSFGERLADIELDGLYYKVRLGAKVGFVNKRAVSYQDELSAVQAERLKQISLDQGNALDSSNLHFENLTEDRVTYSSFGRRDPFVAIKGLLEDGINIDQVELVGIIWESEVPMAILAETKNPSVSYTVKEGDRILNGKVLKITQTDVLFLLQEFGVSRRYSMSLPDKYGRNTK
ncbi:MAG: hypothetical protein M0P13_07790 [Fibrobacteraceae bacterium]|nr:hypothetical protein [Fibrobacteraceae bacterium]